MKNADFDARLTFTLSSYLSLPDADCGLGPVCKMLRPHYPEYAGMQHYAWLNMVSRSIKRSAMFERVKVGDRNEVRRRDGTVAPNVEALTTVMMKAVEDVCRSGDEASLGFLHANVCDTSLASYFRDFPELERMALLTKGINKGLALGTLARADVEGKTLVKLR